MNSKEDEEFTALLLGAVREAEKKKYRPTTFKRMLNEYGGFETVNRVLATGKPSDGFVKLWEFGRLDLTCEAIVVETKWRKHFDKTVLAKAEKLLRESGYEFRRFDEQATAAEPPIPGTVVETEINDFNEQPVDPFSETAIRINAYFKDVLHAPLANVRWSWGAVDDQKRRVFLRVWRKDISSLDGRRVIRVLHGQKRSNGPGWGERMRHLDVIRSGYSAFGVVCERDNQESSSIHDFDRNTLLQFGRVIDKDDTVYLEIDTELPLDTIKAIGSGLDTMDADLREVESQAFSITTRAALVDARLGQGRYRRELLRRWDGACAVTGCRVGAVLRASHCKPWRKSTHQERLDSNNGLILTATIDALFDVGLVSFDDAGKMLVSSALSPQECIDLGLPANLRKHPNKGLCRYLQHHREHVFLGSHSV